MTTALAATLLVLSVMTVIGVAITTLQLILSILKFRQRPADSPREQSAHRPFVSILKPVCGLEDELAENIESFAVLTGVSYEVIVSIAEADDPAIEVVRSVMRRFPNAPFSLVVGGRYSRPGNNRKVERLVAAMDKARGQIIFISDSNVRVAPDDIARTVRHFDDPGTGCVSNIFTGARARTLGARLDSLHLLTFVAPGCIIADAWAVPCVVGKSMAITRKAYEAIGGFEAFADRLGEDQAIGKAVRDAGYGVVLSPVVVRNVIAYRSVSGALDRQLRWGKIRYAFSKLTYTSEFLVNPFANSLLVWGLATMLEGDWAAAELGMAGAVLVVRLIQTVLLAAVTGVRLSLFDLVLVPVKDVLQFLVQFIPYLSNEVAWRGVRSRLGPGTRIVPVNAQ